jgi:hypothetical protein
MLVAETTTLNFLVKIVTSMSDFKNVVAHQKLEYIHFNPVSNSWKLSKNNLVYYYSLARFYETGVNNSGFLNNLYEMYVGKVLVSCATNQGVGLSHVPDHDNGEFPKLLGTKRSMRMTLTVYQDESRLLLTILHQSGWPI